MRSDERKKSRYRKPDLRYFVVYCEILYNTLNGSLKVKQPEIVILKYIFSSCDPSTRKLLPHNHIDIQII